MSKLPLGWVESKLKDIFDTTSGGTPKRGVSAYYGGDIPWLKSGELNDGIIFSAEEYITNEGLQNSSAKLFPKGSLLIALYGATVGKLGILNFDSTTNQAICCIYQHEMYNKYFLFYYLLNHKKYLIKQGKGGAQSNINQEIIKNLIIPLPPLNEQRRIVEKIEEEFGKIDVGVEKLRFALEQIKQYRQAVLKSAFDGKLYKTTEWEEKSLQELTLKIGDVDHKMPKEVKEGVPYISPKDFYGVNGIDFINAKKITKKDYKILSKKIAPNYGDIIFPRYGTIGTLRYVDTEEQFLVSYSCVVIKTINEKAESKYLYYSLLSPQIKSQIQRSIRQTTQANIGIQSIKDFKIKIGIKAEQQQIVKEIEKRLKVADRIETVIRQNLDKAEQLKQSILKKAFEGRLVPQDPNDEPASVLLEKIKAERKNK